MEENNLVEGNPKEKPSSKAIIKKYSSDKLLNNDANPKRQLEETPLKLTASIFLAQHCRLKMKASVAKIKQEMAKSLKMLATKNAPLRPKTENPTHEWQEN